ncbi:hypothetical protein JSE7799_02702 [Jannaschia seosinensis]|uniref:Uncharacterized protein n=1 Tax=Jannaschia seosinensis TaxID=313367 RepID=A0A0M7BDK5_9RHOB|nr:hypothetical protein JSE7799_02702 [Jannaschia seosinensis]
MGPRALRLLFAASGTMDLPHSATPMASMGEVEERVLLLSTAE